MVQGVKSPANHEKARFFAVESPTNYGNAFRGHKRAVSVICRVLQLWIARRKYANHGKVRFSAVGSPTNHVNAGWVS